MGSVSYYDEKGKYIKSIHYDKTVKKFQNMSLYGNIGLRLRQFTIQFVCDKLFMR